MLNRDKIRLMTGLAIYEKHGGSEDLKIAGNYRYDYVLSQLFASFIRYTLCFAMGLVLFLLFRSNEFFLRINTEGFISTMRSYVILYFAGLLLYLLITVVVYIIRHKTAVENTEVYAGALKKLEKRYLSGRNSQK